MIRLLTIAVALAAFWAQAGPAAAQGADFQLRPAAPAPAATPPSIRREIPGTFRRADGGRPPRGLRPKPPESKPPRRPPVHFWPYYFYGERRYEAPEREVVVIEKPEPAPEAIPEPIAPPPRIDACRTDPAAPEAAAGSGRVRFMDPPKDGCPRFARAPAPDDGPPEPGPTQ